MTPFGVRGVGETGTIPPGATVANAICDALADFGVELTELPVTPELVWRAIQEARAQERAPVKVEESFVIDEPQERLWSFFEQVDQVARCVPGVDVGRAARRRQLERARHAGGRAR